MRLLAMLGATQAAADSIGEFSQSALSDPKTADKAVMSAAFRGIDASAVPPLLQDLRRRESMRASKHTGSGRLQATLGGGSCEAFRFERLGSPVTSGSPVTAWLARYGVAARYGVTARCGVARPLRHRVRCRTDSLTVARPRGAQLRVVRTRKVGQTRTARPARRAPVARGKARGLWGGMGWWRRCRTLLRR